MTNDEIKKAYEICASANDCSSCNDCPDCANCASAAALNLINEYEKEIKRLKAENKQLKTECALLDDELRIARQDTIDVLNKVKEKLNNTPNGWAYTTYIDELIKGV